MLDVEINLRLAVAIGYKYPDLSVNRNRVYVPYGRGESICLRQFSYKDDSVIWAIAERFDAFPVKSLRRRSVLGAWCSLVGSHPELLRYDNSPKKAVALSIIAKHEFDKRSKSK